MDILGTLTDMKVKCISRKLHGFTELSRNHGHFVDIENLLGKFHGFTDNYYR